MGANSADNLITHIQALQTTPLPVMNAGDILSMSRFVTYSIALLTRDDIQPINQAFMKSSESPLPFVEPLQVFH